jgi:dUTP pyrophosphatase
MQINIKKVHPAAELPEYATSGAACFDLRALVLTENNSVEVSLPANSAQIFRTGLAFEVPEGHVMLVFSRSGHGFKNGVRLANCVGVIDSDYRGEVMVKLHNDSAHAMLVFNGDRIAQAMILPVQQVSFNEVDELGSTDRGAGGFGSTGVA